MTVTIPGALHSMASLAPTVSNSSLSTPPTSPSSSSLHLTPSRRPSEIRRKPVPRLSDAEQQLLALHTNGSLPSRSNSLPTSQFPKLSSDQKVVPVYLQQSYIPAPVLVKPHTSYIPIVSRKASLQSSISDFSEPSFSPAPTPLGEIAEYRFPLPPSATSTPTMPAHPSEMHKQAGDISSTSTPSLISTESSPTPQRKMSIPPEVMEDCGCGGGDEFDRDQRETNEDGEDAQSEAGESATDLVGEAEEREDALSELSRSLANAAVSGNPAEIRLSHYRWQSASRRAASPMSIVPHSRSATEETDFTPANYLYRHRVPPVEFRKSPNAVSLHSHSPSSSSSESDRSGVDSIFDSYQTEEVGQRHGSLASTDTSTTLASTIHSDEDAPKSHVQFRKDEQRKRRTLSTVGEEQSSRTTSMNVSQSSTPRATVPLLPSDSEKLKWLLFNPFPDTRQTTQVQAIPKAVQAGWSSSRTVSSSGDTSVTSSPSKRRLKREKEEFSSFAKPTPEQMLDAADAMVYTEHGDLVRFGDLWQGQRTIVCFIRHFWCPSCFDYISSVMRIAPEQLRSLNLRLVIVGCGNWKMISGYRSKLTSFLRR